MSFREFWNRLAGRRSGIDEELSLHLEMLAAEHRRRGLSSADADRQARMELGGLTQTAEAYRDQVRYRILDALLSDLRFAARTLVKSPGFAVTAILSLALGIGANTAIFSIFDALVLRPLPVREPDRLYFLSITGRTHPKAGSNVALGLLRELEENPGPIESIAGFSTFPRANIVTDDSSEMTDGLLVSSGYYRVFGVQPAAGRFPEAGEDNVAVISHRYWVRRFGADDGVVGRAVKLNGVSFHLIGVLPEWFAGPVVGAIPDVMIPILTRGTPVPGRPVYNESDVAQFTVVRLRDGVGQGEARDALTARARAQAVRSPAPNAVLEPAERGTSMLRQQFSKPLAVLLCGVMILLLIACINVAGLSLAKAASREREIALRMGIGASRTRILQQFLTESCLVSLLGGGLSLMTVHWVVQGLLYFVSSTANPVDLRVTVDGRMLLFAALVSTLTGIAFGVVPALRSSQVSLNVNLRQAGSGPGGSGLRRAMVASQIALALVLLTVATLFGRSLNNLQSLDPGFRRDNLLVMSVDPTGVGYRGQQIAQLYERVLDRLQSLPGVRGATFNRHTFLSNTTAVGSIWVQGRDARAGDEMVLAKDFKVESGARVMPVGPAFITTMGMALRQGRDFTREDRAGRPRVALVNEAFARYYFPGESAIGKRIGESRDRSGEVEIVGVFRDAKQLNLKEEAVRTVLFPCLQSEDCLRETGFKILTAGEPLAMVPAVRQALREIDPALPVYHVSTMRRVADESMVTERTLALLSTVFGGVALLLAVIGLYGLLSYSVNTRRREIGVRMALGASRTSVRLFILRDTALLAGVGLSAGAAASVLVVRLLEGFLYGVRPLDPVSFGIAAALLAIAALGGSWLPAARAARLHPLEAIRYE